jgi:hypothetical protein
MKAKTDPKTRVTRVVLSSQDVATLCKAADILATAAMWERDSDSATTAETIKTWIDSHEATETPKE